MVNISCYIVLDCVAEKGVEPNAYDNLTLIGLLQ